MKNRFVVRVFGAALCLSLGCGGDDASPDPSSQSQPDAGTQMTADAGFQPDLAIDVTDGGMSTTDTRPADMGRDALEEDVAAPDVGEDLSMPTDPTSITDERDGQVYPVVRLGNLLWLAKHLNFETPAGGSYCYDDNAASCDAEGRLYTLTAARSSCPAGWRLSTDEDWKDLEASLGMTAVDQDISDYGAVRGTTEGARIKAGGDSGFEATLPGYRETRGYFDRGASAYFWAEGTDGQGGVYRRRLSSASTIFRFSNAPDPFQITVRCVSEPVVP